MARADAERMSHRGWAVSGMLLLLTSSLWACVPGTPGPADAGVTRPPDAGRPDAGAPDAGAPDAGLPDAGCPSSCTPGDGCCPGACNANNDTDCRPLCGNGVREPGELCDGDCPTQCDDSNACTVDTLVGSAASCNARCESAPLTACTPGDGCCPGGCNANNDTDCQPACGNRVREPGELCDGDCPTSCDDGNACTDEVLLGSASQCSARCERTTRTTCTGGDRCCPAGCDSESDVDCLPVCGTASSRRIDNEITQASDGHVRSFAFDAQGGLHIVYARRNEGLKYATNVTGAWVIESLGLPVAEVSGIGVDPEGVVHVLYRTNGFLYEAERVQGAWTSYRIAPANIAYEQGDMEIAPSGRIHVVYLGESLRPMYAVREPLSSGYTLIPIDTSNQGGNVRLVLDSAGAVHVAYQIWNVGVRYATRSGSGFTPPTTIPSAALQDIALDPAGVPQILVARTESSRTVLRLASSSPSGWTLGPALLFDTAFTTEPSLVVDVRGHRHLSVLLGNYDLVYLTDKSGTWVQTRIAASAFDSGQLRLDARQRPVLLYRESFNEVLSPLLLRALCPAPSCTADCGGKACGADGCGGSCGTCGSGQVCNVSTGECSACTPDCTGKQCGPNGCGGTCGTCPQGQLCSRSGACQPTCVPDCNGKQCGPDGCGGTCGTCGSGQICTAQGQCQVCTPNCTGKQCGPDGCGGTCGTCNPFTLPVCCPTGRCGRELNASCATNEGCCSGLCDITFGRCVTCRQQYSSCSSDSQCCSGTCDASGHCTCSPRNVPCSSGIECCSYRCSPQGRCE